MEWARILAYTTETVDQELLLRNEYLVAENQILKAQLKRRLRLSDDERAKLGEIGHRPGRKALGEVATAALPDTILLQYDDFCALITMKCLLALLGFHPCFVTLRPNQIQKTQLLWAFWRI